MKRLLLIRHAKSSWKDTELDDHERPLNGRGKRDCVSMAQFIVEQEKDLQALFSSSAVRARTLAEALSKSLAIPLTERQALYTFGSGALASAIRQLPKHYDRVGVVGHNPAITELANHLTKAGIDNVPTSGIVAIDCDCQSWNEVSSAVCSLDYFTAPKLLL